MRLYLARFSTLVLLAALLLAACGGTGTPALPDGEPDVEAVAPGAAQPVVLPTPTPQAAEPAALVTTTTTGTVATTSTAAITAPEAATEAPPAPLPPFDPTATPLTFVPIVEGLAAPVNVTHAGDGSGRLFVLEKGGVIRIVQGDTLSATPFLDIRDRVASGGYEQGLLGLAFPPNHTETGFFFVNYTDRRGDTVVSRFQVTADPNVADPASESLVLAQDQPAANHNGGHLAFGPDGMLWIGLGDGGAANDRFGNGQNPATLLAKMLRLDVTSDPSVPYTIPADNPFVGDTGAAQGADFRDEIWAYGLRNPWRYSFDRATGDLWIADVGQNQYEEINVVPAGSPGGLNFGWPITEGLHCFQQADCSTEGQLLPVLEYGHAGHCSVTGGFVYRGQAIPALVGSYVYGDFCSGQLWVASPDGAGGWQARELFRLGAQLTSFGEDEAGEIYMVDYAGRLSRLAAQ